jgi:hypothetical protein
MCTISDRKNSMESTIFLGDTDTSAQLHAVVIPESI